MSSTYSPDLRIELIGTGDQAGVWGATTNTNLAYVLEQSIAGYVSVSVTTANQALTYINGGSSVAADNQSVHASLALTTTTTANFAIYAPPASKQYTIYNASSYVATIYNSTVIGNTTAAGTGVAIPAGKTMTVWSDGTNFSQQNTHLISPTIATGTLTSPTMTGTPVAPTATSTDSSTQVATTAFVQAQKASPTFTGTPAAPTASYGTNTTQLATTAFVQAALQALYPVGSIYSSTVSTNPGTLFGFGTWVAYAAGRVLLGTDGSTYAAGATGGSATTTISTSNLPSHTHSFSATTGASNLDGTFCASNRSGPGPTGSFSNTGNYYNSSLSGGGLSGDINQYQFSGNHTHSVSGTTGSAGSGSAVTTISPYVVVYMWTRTA